MLGLPQPAPKGQPHACAIPCCKADASHAIVLFLFYAVAKPKEMFTLQQRARTARCEHMRALQRGRYGLCLAGVFINTLQLMSCSCRAPCLE